VHFEGRWDKVWDIGLNPLPLQKPIPMWIGASGVPTQRIRRRIGQLSDGWFVLCSPEEFPDVRDDIYREAEAVGRDPKTLGIEAGVAVVGPREHEWRARVAGWRDIGLTHLCLRTLGGDLKPDQHINRMRDTVAELPGI
jgi:alkanesulfonate monooxygenase SsuD/methylene tetrahydromethanopterin reductase-like flavin-dependent oxidoreductase (luciferase family)